ncbi:transmembrane protein, putative (macronuclear) [Tetrahymena thermophila SB210]|uniref:Transmembrane protein, putative n=1 Tax=Tetrahymena thermophila (strain SB210) TaxID=312017 RepID=W7XCE8_TETTS|nr:transmembrane protein, putative [Tetrahymena thermophila SB210]EWS74228.1 transmembrane protein, putative [Tetrahymena thermophila SB210]|eukprot:XP_012653201.1 transmembrane protein, putative [Tetrahymena thermophila SB210]
MIIPITITSTFLIIILQVVKIKAVGCPFRLDGCTNQDLRVKQILLLKSNPQSDLQDIAAVVYNPFTVGIFNFETNKQLKVIEQQESVAFYQIDKDDRPQLQASIIHTLDANGRVITWNSGNGFKQNVVQIPNIITIQPNSCLNSEEMLVLTWDDTKIYIIDFSQQQNIQYDSLNIDTINIFSSCFNDKINRRFLIMNQQGQLYSYDIQKKIFSLLFQINQFKSLQSLYLTQNQISISYQSSQDQNFVTSYKNNTLQFKASFSQISTSILVSNQEDILILIGNNNLFTIWEIKSQKIIYIPDFQKIYCDSRDSNNTKVDEVINFKFGSINQKDEVAVVSDSYIFVYSLLENKPILFKSQNLGLSWIQAFVVQNSVILSQTYSVSSIDKRTSRINYLMNYFSNGQSSYDQPMQLEVDYELNRVLYSDFTGNFQIWSYYNNQQEKIIKEFRSTVFFILDKQLNRIVLYTNSTSLAKIQIYDYQEVKLLGTLSFPNKNSQYLDTLSLYQDKTNGYLLGFDNASTKYAIYRFTEESNFPTLYNCTLINNGIITNDNIYFLESSKQFLIEISSVLYMFSYFPDNGNTLTSYIVAGKKVKFSYFQYINSVQTLICVQDASIQIYQYSNGQFNLQNQINYYSGQSNSIFLAEAQNTLIIQRTSQLFFKNYLTQNDQMINFNNLQILNYQYDSSKALLICLDSSFMITVIDVFAVQSLYHIQIEENKIALFNIQKDANFIIISYFNGQILIYDYQANVIISTYNNYKYSLIFKFDKSNNNLILQSQLEVSSKRLINLGLISQINYSLFNYWIDEMTGLTFIISDQIIVYNPLSQEYLPQFSVDFDLSFAYVSYYIPQLDFLLIGFQDNQVNQVFVYKLSSQTLVATLDHNINHCFYTFYFFYDVYSKRLFSGCAYPASVIVWDLNNFKMIKLLDSILQSSFVCSIKFYPQIETILMTGYNWWSVTVDYNTLEKRCQVMGIFGDFDYRHNLQILWDQNGDFRIFDINCHQIAFQHAHTGWIQQLLIDQVNMYLTTLGQDQYIKLWSYQNITQPKLITQRFLTYSLTYGLLDYDNNLVLAVDYQGFLYILSYPDLNILKAIQANFGQIDFISLNKPFNLIVLASQETNSLSFYNLFELIAPNQNELYFRYEGILSTLMTDQGVIFHQLGNIVQFWNYSIQKLIYGFFVNSQFESLEAESRFLSLSGYQNLAVLFTRDQTIFFNTITLDIINVQQLKCMNSIQIQIFLICALTNKLTVFSLDSFSIYQQIALNPNQSIIQLQQIFQTDSFFATTTQGEIICYQLQSNQILSKFQIKILNQAIVNYQQIQLNEFYIILASAFDGSFGCIQISIDLNNINKLDFNLPGKSSHAHKIIYFNNNLFIKRISDYYLGVYNINNLNQITQIKSPCVGYTYKLDFSQEYDLVLQSCIGNYRINQLSTFQEIVYGRFTTQLKLTKKYTDKLNQIIFINKDYFIDAYDHSIFIFQIDYQQSKINLIGSYQGDNPLGSIASYNIIKDQNNIFIQLLLYSIDKISKVQLPIQGDNSCKELLSYNQFSEVLFSIQDVYQQIQNYFKIEEMIFTLTVDKYTYLQPLSPFTFSQITKLSIMSDPAQNNNQSIIVSQELFSSFQGYDYISLENFNIQSSKSESNNQSFKINNLNSFILKNIQFTNQSLFQFDISLINTLIFENLQFQNIQMSSKALVNLFKFSLIDTIIINEVEIIQCSYKQITLFNFQDDINNQKTSILFSGLVVNRSQFNYDNTQLIAAPLYISNYNKVEIQNFVLNSNIGNGIFFIVSNVIQNISINGTSLLNNKDILFLSYSHSLQQTQNKIILVQQITEDSVQLKNLILSNNFFNISQQKTITSIIDIKTSNLTLHQCQIQKNNAQQNNQISILSLSQLVYFNSLDLNFTNNQGFQSLLTLSDSFNINQISQMFLQNNSGSNLLLIAQSNLFFTDSSVLQNLSYESNQQSSAISILSNSSVVMSNIQFEDNISSKGGSIYVQNSELIIGNSWFYNDKSTYGGSIYSENTILSISNSQFNNCTSSFGGCIYAYQSEFKVDSINSSYAKASQDGGFLYINNINRFTLSNLNIQYCSAQNDGGSIYIINSGGIDSFITSSNFNNNKALGSGGVLLLDNSELLINYTSFKYNSAGVGGVIRYLNLKPSFLFNKQKNMKDSCKTYSFNYCKQNKAIIFGNQIASYPTYASIFPNYNFNVDIRQYPNITFHNFRSGLNNFDLFIQFLDEFKDIVQQIDFQNQTKIDQISQNLLNEIKQYSCKVYVNQNFTDLQSEVIKLDGSTSAEYSYYGQNKIGCQMNNFKITGVPESSSFLMLQLNGMRITNSTNQFVDLNNVQIKIEFRQCEVGEFYTQNCEGCQLYECSQCQNGTYSLIKPEKNKQIQCKECDKSQVESCYLSEINLRENYWRTSNSSDQIYACSNTFQQCNGDQSKGYCNVGYTGALCSACDNYGDLWGDSYGQVISLDSQILQCEKCSEISQNFYKQTFIIILILFYLIFMTIESQNNNCKICQINLLQRLNILNMGVSQYIFQSSVILKIIINQFYILSTLKYINISESFNTMISMPSLGSQHAYIFKQSLDCLLVQLNINLKLQYLRFIYISIILPLLTLALIYIFIKIILALWIYLKPENYFYEDAKYNHRNMVISTLILFSYITTSNIQQSALELIFCERFDNQYFMKSQMNEKCYTQEHYFYIAFLISPILILVSVVQPVIILYILYKNIKKASNTKQFTVIRRYGYYFKEYKKTRWWWEIIRIQQKFIVSILGAVFKKSFITLIQSILFCQTIYLLILTYFQPYEDRKINRLERNSAILTLLIFWVALLNQQNQDNFIYQVSLTLLMLLFIILFGFLASSFLGVLIKRNMYVLYNFKFFLWFQQKIKKYTNRQDKQPFIVRYLKNHHFDLYNILFSDSQNQFRVFKNWKKVKNLILGTTTIHLFQSQIIKQKKQKYIQSNRFSTQISNIFTQKKQNTINTKVDSNFKLWQKMKDINTSDSPKQQSVQDSTQ